VLPLRYPMVWSAFGWLLVLGVIVGSLVPGNSLPTIFSFHDKLLHVAAYLALTLWFTGLYRRGLYPSVAAVLFALGVALDMLQGLTATRSLDWYDVAADVVGISVGLAISFAYLGGWCQRVEERLLS
jgi:VanZ family protein